MAVLLKAKSATIKNYMDVILIVLPLNQSLLPAQQLLSDFEEDCDNHGTEDCNHYQACVNSAVKHHCFLVTDVPADSIFCTEHFGSHKGNKCGTDSVESSLENIWQGSWNCNAENLKEGSGSKGFTDFEINLTCILNAGTCHQLNREPDCKCYDEYAGTKRGRKSCKHKGDPGGGRNWSNQFDVGINPVIYATAEAQENAGDKTNRYAPENSEQEQAEGIPDAFSKQGCLFYKNCEYVVETWEKDYR